MIRVKFCGITNIDDAMKAVDLGAEALGFIFAPSPRRIDPRKAKEIIKKLPPWVAAVGVFVDEDLKKLIQVKEECGIDWIQLHGNESPPYCQQLGLKIIKTIKRDIREISNYDVSGILLDTYDVAKAGGTGKVFDWEIAREAKKYGKPIILAGGLTPNNVIEALEKVNPYGVEANSGVESSPGKKDHQKMKAFIEKVRSLKVQQ